jgi:hypothetical protein
LTTTPFFASDKAVMAVSATLATVKILVFQSRNNTDAETKDNNIRQTLLRVTVLEMAAVCQQVFDWASSGSRREC